MYPHNSQRPIMPFSNRCAIAQGPKYRTPYTEHRNHNVVCVCVSRGLWYTVLVGARAPRPDPAASLNLCSETAQSHLPSFQPVRHRSSHLEQSNSGLPNLRLTSLCAPHSHLPNSSRLLTCGASRFRYPWKSSAQTQQGYSLENSPTKLRRSDFWPLDGCSGY